MPYIDDSKGYRARCVPRPHHEAQTAVNKFIDEVRELMKTHGIADVVMNAQLAVTVPARDLTEEDAESTVSLCCHFGDTTKAVEMAAYLKAYMRGEFEQILARAAVNGEKRGRM